MKSNYGNYVVQRALKLSNGKTHEELIFAVSENIEKLNDKKLISKWKTIMETYIGNILLDKPKKKAESHPTSNSKTKKKKAKYNKSREEKEDVMTKRREEEGEVNINCFFGRMKSIDQLSSNYVEKERLEYMNSKAHCQCITEFEKDISNCSVSNLREIEIEKENLLENIYNLNDMNIRDADDDINSENDI